MPSPPPIALSVESVSKSYFEAGHRHEVLRSVDLQLERGTFAALLGRSGAGKSTLLNVLSGIDAPDAGRIVIAGNDVSSMGEEERTAFRRRHLGFVFQAFNLIPTLTVAENVALPLTLNGMPAARAIERARALLDRVGLGDRFRAWPDRLSGGEQQRVAVVRALIHEPTLLLADEPTGNLDWETGRTVMDLLHGLVREFGVTMLVVTHDSEFLSASDTVLRLRSGRLERVDEVETHPGSGGAQADRHADDGRAKTERHADDGRAKTERHPDDGRAKAEGDADDGRAQSEGRA